MVAPNLLARHAAACPRLPSYKVTPRQQGDYQNLVLSEAELKDEAEGIKKFIKDNNLLAASSPEDVPQVTALIRGAKSGRDRGSMQKYQQYWRELGRFAVKIGDYRTAAICSDAHRPTEPMSADPETVTMWFCYKAQAEGTPVLQPRKTVTAKWKDGTDILAVGQWKASVNIVKAQTAIRTLHHNFTFCRGKYIPKCQRCVAANTTNGVLDSSQTGQNWKSCDRHSGRAALHPEGNVMDDEHLSSKFKSLMKILKNDHTVKGNVQLLPSHVRKLRAFLLSQSGPGAAHSQQNYVMLLLGIKLFLRADELLSLKFENFTTNCFAVETNPERIDRLVLWVKGKSDTDKVWLSLYRDDENPEFCPIRHLLAYVRCMKLTGGYLFPAWEFLKPHLANDGSREGSFDQHVTYAHFRDRMQVS